MPHPRGQAIDSVAVLPFTNDGADANMEYLSDGITESLINNLSQLPNLRVAARSAVFRYKAKQIDGNEIDPQRIGQDLHVTAVLSGRLIRRGDTLIVRAELTDVAKSSQLWGGQFTRKPQDVFALQEDLAREISEKLKLRLTGEEKQRLTKRYTEDAEAYQLYLKGRYHWNKRNPESYRKALEYFQQAVDKDPTYALAYAGIADTYAQLSFFNVFPPSDVMPKAKAAAEKSLAIDDHLGEAHVSLGYVSFTYDFDWTAAGKHFDQAIALNPTYTRTHSFYPLYLSSKGLSDQAIAVATAALELDPASPGNSHTLAVQLFLAGRFDQAIDQCRKTIELDPTVAVAYSVIGQSYSGKAMDGEGLPADEKYLELSRDSAMSIALLGYTHARLGERGKAFHALEQLSAASKQSYTPAFAFAWVYTGLEDKEHAFEWLEKARARAIHSPRLSEAGGLLGIAAFRSALLRPASSNRISAIESAGNAVLERLDFTAYFPPSGGSIASPYSAKYHERLMISFRPTFSSPARRGRLAGSLPILAMVIGFVPTLAPTLCGQQSNEILPLSQVQPGMHGYAYTIFAGDQVEKFDL